MVSSLRLVRQGNRARGYYNQRDLQLTNRANQANQANQAKHAIDQKSGFLNLEDNFCPSCAAALETKEVFGHERPVCPDCARVIFYDPKVAVVCIVPRDGKVLMIRRATDQGYGLWGLPGGYVDRGEVVERAAAREVWEETGLRVEPGELIGLFSEEDNPVMVAVYDARETGGTLEAGPEALEVGFFDIDDLPELAFPRDREVLAKWKADLGA